LMQIGFGDHCENPNSRSRFVSKVAGSAEYAVL
jgi:hypothetical protein